MRKITAKEFDKLRSTSRSPWSKPVAKLAAGDDNDVRVVPIPDDCATSFEREKCRCAIYSMGRHHGILVTTMIRDGMFYIKRVRKVAPGRARLASKTP